MKAVLGIDAAWTETQPSGVALAIQEENGWRLESIAPCYDDFLSGIRSEQPKGCIPDPKGLLESVTTTFGLSVSLIAIDMPISLRAFSERRKADDIVSRIFGNKGAGTHSPNKERPGKIGTTLVQSFQREGYGVATNGPGKNSLLEVYPHPALIALTGADYRLPYKFARLRTYREYQGLPMPDRRYKLLRLWAQILESLDKQINGVSKKFTAPAIDAPRHTFKAFEDMLDAVVCCWVGICALEGRAEALGDETAAIWVPDCEDVEKFRKRRLAELMKKAKGMIDSGIPDLASNPKHLEGLGGDSMGR